MNNHSTLPEEVRSLVARKLRHQRREQEELLVAANQKAYSKLIKEITANIRSGKLGRAFISVPMEAYREIVANATAITDEWPNIAWKSIIATLDKAELTPGDGSGLNRLFDEFVWAIGQSPFTLDYVSYERFKDFVHREANRCGVIRQDVLASFNSQLGLTAVAAQCGILNTARQAREGIGIAIDEYVVAHRQISLPSNQIGGSLIDLLPNPPKKANDWFLVIRDMTSEFYKANKRLPNEVEAWETLRNNPPATYGIETCEHHGEHAVCMNGLQLGKRAFAGRWRRYLHKVAQ